MDDSQCRKNFLCEFEISQDLYDALIEICKNCGKKVVYNKVDGRVDSDKYLRDHLRDTVQPRGRTGKLFLEIYGSEPIEQARRMGARLIMREKIKEMKKEVVERRKFLHRKAGGHSMIKEDWEPPPFVKKVGFQK